MHNNDYSRHFESLMQEKYKFFLKNNINENFTLSLFKCQLEKE